MSYSRVTTAKGQRLLGFDPNSHSDRLSPNKYQNRSILDNTPMTQTKYIHNYSPVNSSMQYNVHGGGQYPRNYNQSPVPSYYNQPSQNQYQYSNPNPHQQPYYTPNTNIPINNQSIHGNNPNYPINYSQDQRLAYHPQTQSHNQYASPTIQTSRKSSEQDETKSKGCCKKIILGLLVALLLLAILAAVLFYLHKNHLLWFRKSHENYHSQERQSQLDQIQESERTYYDAEQYPNSNQDNSHTAYQIPSPYSSPQPQQSIDSSFMFPPNTQRTANTGFMLPPTTHLRMRMRHFSDT